jgi:ubiquinol-cytochrome c reductase cytochrome c1 subunit
MTRTICLVCILLIPAVSAWGAESAYPMDRVRIDLTDQPSLQRGARLFVNYCQGCHSAEFQRYNRLARDIGLTDRQVQEHLILTGAKVGEQMRNAMDRDEAKQWFGAPPPDLTLIARSRGTDYLYTYLRTFYQDDSRPLGANNAAFPNVGMPHVLWELQGWRKPIFETVTHADGHGSEQIVGFEQISPGSMSPGQFDSAMRDLVNFLAYIAEPVRLERESMGWKVILFIIFMTVVFYLLKKEYWRDVR